MKLPEVAEKAATAFLQKIQIKLFRIYSAIDHCRTMTVRLPEKE
jgi:hypothetical protein